MMDSGEIKCPSQQEQDVLDGQAERIFREAGGRGQALDFLWQAVKVRKARLRIARKHQDGEA